MRVPFQMAITLVAPLSIAECKQRITQGIDPENPFENWLSSRPILGRVYGDTVRLQCRRKYRNSFAPIYFGELEEASGKTYIHGHFRMHFLVINFLLSVVCMLTTASILSGQLVVCGMFLPLLALIGAGYGMGKDEEKAIIQFLQTTLEADIAKEQVSS